MSKKHRNGCRFLNYFEHSLIVTYTITGRISISAFASLVGVLVGITCSAIQLTICKISAAIKKYKSIIIKKKRKKHDKIVFLAKSKSNNVEVLICKVLFDSNISHDEFVLINNVLK